MPTLGQFGVEPIAISHGPKTIEGEPANHLVILEFPDEASAQAWHDSEAYRTIIHLRIEASAPGGWATIVPHFTPPG